MQLTIVDLLALIDHQAQVVSSVAKGLLAADQRATPEVLTSTTLRLSEMVNALMKSLPQPQSFPNGQDHALEDQPAAN